MKPSQWITLGIFFFLGFLYFFILGFGWSANCSIESSILTACYIKVQSYIIPAFILFFLAIAFWICAGLEKKK